MDLAKQVQQRVSYCVAHTKITHSSKTFEKKNKNKRNKQGKTKREVRQTQQKLHYTQTRVDQSKLLEIQKKKNEINKRRKRRKECEKYGMKIQQTFGIKKKNGINRLSLVTYLLRTNSYICPCYTGTSIPNKHSELVLRLRHEFVFTDSSIKTIIRGVRASRL